MLTGRNTRRCAHAIRLVAVLLVVVVLGRPASAQQVATDPPDPGRTMEAFRIVRAGLDRWRPPPDSLLIEDLGGACVTLFYGGRLVGRGSAIGPDAVIVASEQAMAQAERKLPGDRDAMWQQTLELLGPQVSVSLELAGPLIPLTDREIANVSVALSPGLEGVAVRRREDAVAIFPSEMRYAASDPSGAIARCVAEITSDPAMAIEPPSKLKSQRGFSMYRFELTHVAQPTANEPGVFLHRGSRIIEPGSLTGADIASHTDALAHHLTGRFVERDDGTVVLLGLVRPSTNQISGEVSPGWALHQALAAYALARYAALDAARPPAMPARRMAVEALRTLGGDCGAHTGTHATAALFVLAIDELYPDEPPEDLAEAREKAVARVLSPDGQEPSVPEADAIVVWGRMHLASRGEADAQASEAALRELYARTQAGMLVSLMPWLGLAELELSDGDGMPAGGVALIEMRDVVYAHQLSVDDLDPRDRDLEGGIVFTKGTTPLPTWQGLRALSILAAMLGDGSLTPDADFSDELARLLPSLRFVCQLTLDDGASYLYADRSLALGGARAAIWDGRMPEDASSLALITLTETLESLREVSERRAGGDGNGAREAVQSGGQEGR